MTKKHVPIKKRLTKKQQKQTKGGLGPRVTSTCTADISACSSAKSTTGLLSCLC